MISNYLLRFIFCGTVFWSAVLPGFGAGFSPQTSEEALYSKAILEDGTLDKV